jgi:hypothetical protein
MLLLAGLWTPISGALVAVFELWDTFSQPGDPWAKILLGALGVALALLGPGAWSIDARLFGWKRIDIRARKNWTHKAQGHGCVPANPQRNTTAFWAARLDAELVLRVFPRRVARTHDIVRTPPQPVGPSARTFSIV